MSVAFRTRDVAKITRQPAAWVRACAREGLVGRKMSSAPKSHFRYDFRDLAVLRAASRLVSEGLPRQRVQRALENIRRSLPADMPLSGAQISRLGDRILVDTGDLAWDAENGQCCIPFDAEDTDTAPTPLPFTVPRPVRDRPPGPAPQTHGNLAWDSSVLSSGMGADEDFIPAGASHVDLACSWFELGLGLEEVEPERAYHAYLQTLACNPEHIEATINIGRLCSSQGDSGRAAAYFRQAIRIDPAHPIAHFNLGVTHHDLGQAEEAIEAYRNALLHDPQFADAHYNLATLLEQRGDRRGALRHMNAYRMATRQDP